MGIRFLCPSGHKLNVKTFLAGKRAICPECGAKVIVPALPAESTPEAPLAATAIANSFARSAEINTGLHLDAASPSVALEVAETEPTAPMQASALPDSVFTVPSSLGVLVDPNPVTNDQRLDLRRDRTRRNQMVLLVVLAMVVIVLAGVLVWVLGRDAATPEPGGEESTQVSTSRAIEFANCHMRA